MTEVMQTVDQIVALLDKFERPIEIALVVVLTMLARNVKQNTAAISPCSPVPIEDKAAVKAQKAEAKAQEKTKAVKKKVISEEMTAALDVYFSDKAYEDMTESEQALYNKAAAFLGGA